MQDYIKKSASADDKPSAMETNVASREQEGTETEVETAEGKTKLSISVKQDFSLIPIQTEFIAEDVKPLSESTTGSNEDDNEDDDEEEEVAEENEEDNDVSDAENIEDEDDDEISTDQLNTKLKKSQKSKEANGSENSNNKSNAKKADFLKRDLISSKNKFTPKTKQIIVRQTFGSKKKALKQKSSSGSFTVTTDPGEYSRSLVLQINL